MPFLLMDQSDDSTRVLRAGGPDRTRLRKMKLHLGTAKSSHLLRTTVIWGFLCEPAHVPFEVSRY